MLLADAVDPVRDHIRGAADAPLTLVEHGDYECPFCGRATGVANELEEWFGDRLRDVFRHLPLPDVYPHAGLAARAAEAAGAQARVWEMHDVLFARHDELGLDVERFARDLDDEALAAPVRDDGAGAGARGARGTPTLFVDGRRHVGAYDAMRLAAELESGERPMG